MIIESGGVSLEHRGGQPEEAGPVHGYPGHQETHPSRYPHQPEGGGLESHCGQQVTQRGRVSKCY